MTRQHIILRVTADPEAAPVKSADTPQALPRKSAGITRLKSWAAGSNQLSRPENGAEKYIL